MAKVYIKPYDRYTVSGTDFCAMQSDNIHRVVFSPNNMNAISLTQLPDGALLLTNHAKLNYNFSVSIDQKVLAVYHVDAVAGEVKVNTNWCVSSNGVRNIEIHTNPDLFISNCLNFDLEGSVYGPQRIDIKVDESGFACCAFIATELLFVRMNGNRAFPKLVDEINNCCINAPATAGKVNEFLAKNPKNLVRIGKHYVQQWMRQHGWGSI